MSILYDRLKTDQVAARKAAMKAEGDAKEAHAHNGQFLSLLISKVEQAVKDEPREPETEPREIADEDVVQVLRKQQKNLDDALTTVTQDDQRQKLLHDKGIIAAYLPTPLTGPDLDHAIAQAMVDLGVERSVKSTKAVAALLETRYPGQITPAAVSSYLRSA